MRVLFDTFVLVAALVASHPLHRRGVIRLNQVLSQEMEGLISTHTLAELYSVLTRLPVRPRISPELAQRLIFTNLQQFEIVPLEIEDYQTAIAQMVTLNLPGGGIFDTLIAQAALKAEVDRLLTLNHRSLYPFRR